MKRVPRAQASMGVWGHAPQKINLRGLEMLFSVFYTRYFINKSISIQSKMTGTQILVYTGTCTAIFKLGQLSLVATCCDLFFDIILVASVFSCIFLFFYQPRYMYINFETICYVVPCIQYFVFTCVLSMVLPFLIRVYLGQIYNMTASARCINLDTSYARN